MLRNAVVLWLIDVDVDIENCCRTVQFRLEIHFITSKKGHRLLVYEHFTYALNCRSKNKTSWTCSSRCSKRCTAQIILTNADELVVVDSAHTHPPPVFYVNELGQYVRANQKQLSTLEETDSPKEITEMTEDVLDEETLEEDYYEEAVTDMQENGEPIEEHEKLMTSET
ncbi:FLYWCH zinc finger domain-containing protein [Phthorimaea operculella]|nr:FLYWCH zinc finger domain-containing protein [Phthorimaea operculella]